MHVQFNKIGTLGSEGRFPDATAIDSIMMPLQLSYYGQHILDVDWIDYRGGDIDKLANGEIDESNSEIYSALLVSDVILVFIDAIKVKENSNATYLRGERITGAANIMQILNNVHRTKKALNIIFILSKADSSTINIRTDYESMKASVLRVYNAFFVNNNISPNEFPIIPVGCVGIGNVSTTINKYSDDLHSVRIYDNRITSEGITPFNVDVSFAYALELCRRKLVNETDSEILMCTKELQRLENKFGNVRQILDLLFNDGRRREGIFDLKQKLLKNNDEKKVLENHKETLKRIWSKGTLYFS